MEAEEAVGVCRVERLGGFFNAAYLQDAQSDGSVALLIEGLERP